MFTLTPQQALLIGFIVAPILFALCAYFTRANVRRIASALVGAAAYGVINYGWDQVAVRVGWWSYPAWLGTGRAPLTLYVLASIVGGAMGLIGWRIVRRWGRKAWLVSCSSGRPMRWCTIMVDRRHLRVVN